MSQPRKDKICFNCDNFMPETSTVDADCVVDEDIEDDSFCDQFCEKGVRSHGLGHNDKRESGQGNNVG